MKKKEIDDRFALDWLVCEDRPFLFYGAKEKIHKTHSHSQIDSHKTTVALHAESAYCIMIIE